MKKYVFLYVISFALFAFSSLSYGSKDSPALSKQQKLDMSLIHFVNKVDKDSVKELLLMGADVNAQYEKSGTALMIAVKMSNKEIVELLLAHKDINVNIQTQDDGLTALMIALIEIYFLSNRKKIVKLLLAHKDINVNIQTQEGITALMFAVEKGDGEIVELLLDKGADIDAKAKGGLTALMFAAYHGNEKAVEKLLDRGADIETQNTNGLTALTLAKKREHTKVAEQLKRASCKRAIAGG